MTGLRWSVFIMVVVAATLALFDAGRQLCPECRRSFSVFPFRMPNGQPATRCYRCWQRRRARR